VLRTIKRKTAMSVPRLCAMRTKPTAEDIESCDVATLDVEILPATEKPRSQQHARWRSPSIAKRILAALASDLRKGTSSLLERVDCRWGYFCKSVSRAASTRCFKSADSRFANVFCSVSKLVVSPGSIWMSVATRATTVSLPFSHHSV
jgi:hypothetical protein